MGKVFVNNSSPSSHEITSHSFFASRSVSVRENGSHTKLLEQPTHSEMKRSRSSNPQSAPPVEIGATGSIFSLVDRDISSGSLHHKVVDPVGDSGDQTASRRERLWMRGSRRKASSWSDTLTKDGKRDAKGNRLERVEEADETVPKWADGKIPKWKQFLRKLKGDAKNNDASKGSSNFTKTSKTKMGHARQQSHSEFLRDKQAKASGRGDKQSSIIHWEPLPVPAPREKPSTLIWERRNVGQISALDLKNLKSTRARRAARASAN